MTESRIQKDILDYLRSLGLWCWAFKPEVCSERGVPDIICCYKGWFVGLEVKTQKGKVTGAQRVQLKRIRNARGRGAVVRSVDNVRTLLTEIDEELDGEAGP